MARHRRGYKFTGKTHSRRGAIALFLAAASLAVLACAIAQSFISGGNASLYFGSAGVASMAVGIFAFALAIRSLMEEDSFKLFPYMATAAGALAAGLWVALYVAGILSSRA